MPDILVVGGGPAGSLSASMLAADGREVTLIEEHDTIGTPVHCAGIVSDSLLRSIPVSPNILSVLRRARVIFPDGRAFELERSSPYGYIIDRPDLDRKLCDHAEKNGVEIQLGTCFNSLSYEGNKVVSDTNKGEIRSDLIIGADGQASDVAAAVDAGYSKEYLLGAQADVPCEDFDTDLMELRIGNKVAPGFFSWKVPAGDGIVRYGLCVVPSAGNVTSYLQQLLKEDGIDPKSKNMVRFGGKIPIGYRTSSVGERALLIGDAASQVKPVSGGGLSPIVAIAPILCDTVREAYNNNLFTKAVLGQYDVTWKREMKSVFEDGLKMRKRFCSLSDQNMNRVGEIFDTPAIREHLGNIDIDDPWGIAKDILAEKGVKRKLASVFLKAMLWKK